jgi:monoamine oxidase
LINFLMDSVFSQGALIQFFSEVQKIEYEKDHVKVYAGNKQYYASRVIVTVSAGILQSGTIEFVPALKEHSRAFSQLGFGPVVKILFQFKEPFWFEKLGDIGFLITNEAIPTWWTQNPDQAPILTGWLGGPGVLKVKTNEIYDRALNSLSSIFNCEISSLSQQLTHHQIISWHEFPFIQGGYSYSTLDSSQARKVLLQPANDGIYFAGEAVYEGEFQGTVEAALQSGKSVAEKIKKM